MNDISIKPQLLKKLALAMVDHPRGTTKDLAESSGISKATLHRLCGTRENLASLLQDQSHAVIEAVIELALREHGDHEESLRALAAVHLSHKEYLRYVCSAGSCGDDAFWEPYLRALDAFFLSGQKHGAFRIELSSAAMTELFVAGISGLIDAQRRGRVVLGGLEESFADFFLKGIRNPD